MQGRGWGKKKEKIWGLERDRNGITTQAAIEETLSVKRKIKEMRWKQTNSCSSVIHLEPPTLRAGVQFHSTVWAHSYREIWLDGRVTASALWVCVLCVRLCICRCLNKLYGVLSEMLRELMSNAAITSPCSCSAHTHTHTHTHIQMHRTDVAVYRHRLAAGGSPATTKKMFTFFTNHGYFEFLHFMCKI